MADLQVLQNKAARVVLDLPPRASASDALAKLHWKPLLRRRAKTPYGLGGKMEHYDHNASECMGNGELIYTKYLFFGRYRSE